MAFLSWLLEDVFRVLLGLGTLILPTFMLWDLLGVGLLGTVIQGCIFVIHRVDPILGL